MTCFWSGVIQHLKPDDFKIIGLAPVKRKNLNEIKKFINKLKTHATSSSFNIKWQNQNLSESEIKDLKMYICEYNINNIQKGHYTSSCDPFLCLLTDKLKCKIIFNYCNNKIIFQTKEEIRKTFKFRATKSHFTRG